MNFLSIWSKFNFRYYWFTISFKIKILQVIIEESLVDSVEMARFFVWLLVNDKGDERLFDLTESLDWVKDEVIDEVDDELELEDGGDGGIDDWGKRFWEDNIFE